VILDALSKLARLLPPEPAHRAGIVGLKLGLGRFAQPVVASDRLATTVSGLTLPNPIGLAAGFDKNAEVIDAALGLGFGFVEAGAVTPLAQPGNPKPRFFRLAQDRAVINRFGFNNAGIEAFAARLELRRGRPGIVGVNLGANKDGDDRVADYVTGLKRLWGLADFFTVNVSSPNTPGLRDLQGRDALSGLLDRVAEARAAKAGNAPAAPLFVKVAPDLDDDAIETIADVARETAVDGLIVSNTTISRPPGLHGAHVAQAGGLSGRPLFELSTKTLRGFRQATGGRMTLIGVGGVESGATAYAKIRAGASAVQLYTAMAYDGPGVVARIVRELDALLVRDGFACVADAVGADVRV